MRSLPLLETPLFSEYDGGERFFFQEELYTREKYLGAGSFGQVFCFVATNSDTRYAVKCEKECSNGYLAGMYFEREANWYQKIYGVGLSSGNLRSTQSQHYMLMTYFSGETLQSVAYSSVQHIFFQSTILFAGRPLISARTLPSL